MKDLEEFFTFEFIISFIGLVIASLYAPDLGHLFAAWLIVIVLILIYLL
jgi:hypothetical protein